jgi:fucose permease
LTGSGLAAASMAIGAGSLAHLTPIAVLGFTASLTASRGLLPPAPRHTRQKRPLRWPPASLLGLGALAFAVLLCEGAAADWSAVYLRNDLGTGPEYAVAGFGAFSLAMAVGRLCGDRLVLRFGPVAVVRGSAALAAVGLAAALLIGRAPAAVVGFACLGLGCSNVVPVLFSAAGRTPDAEPTRALAVVTVMGYTALLAGPPLIGLVAQAASLRTALALLVFSSGLIVVFGGMVRGKC